MLILLWFVAVLALAAGARLPQCARHRLERRARAVRSPSPGARISSRTGSPLALAGLFALVAIPLNVPALRRALISDRVLARLPQGAAADVADRARGDRGRHRLVGRRALLRPARLEQAARAARADAHARRAALPRPRGRGAVRDGDRLGDDATSTTTCRPHVWQFIKDKGFLGMIIPKEYGGLGFSAYAHSQVMTKLSTHSGTIAVTVMVPNSLGPGRAARALRHRGAEAPLPAAPRQGPRDPVLRAHQPDCGLRRGRDPRLRHRLLGRARRQASARHARHVGEALHHARPGRDAARPRVPRLRSRPSGRRQGRYRHHLRARSRPRIPASRSAAATCRSTRCSRTARTAGSDVFIPMDWIIGGQPMLGRGWRMLMECLAAGRGISLPSSSTGHGQARGARDRRLRARAHAVQDADRQLRRHRGGARRAWAATST